MAASAAAAASPEAGEEAGDDGRLDEGDRAEVGPVDLDGGGQVGERRARPTGSSGTAMVGRPIPTTPAHRFGSNPAASTSRTRSGCDSLA